MKIAIFGCRDGAYLQEQIKKHCEANVETICFCDNSTVWHNNTIDGIKVVSAEKLSEMYSNGEVEAVVVAVRKGYSRYCIIKQLHDFCITKIILTRPSPLTYRLPFVFDKNNSKYYRYWLPMEKNNKPIIHHLEAHVADGCNLNCKGCLHFSNLFDKDEFPNLDELLDSVLEISKHCEIFQFRVLGGEPLLNSDLERFLVRLREILPNTDLAVISNGILVPQMPDSLLNTMRTNDIGFNLTLYPPTLKMKEQIYGILEKTGVSYGSHESKTDKFEKFMRLTDDRMDNKAYEKCVSRGILTLKGKKIYRCPPEAYIGKYYSTFNVNLNPPEGIDVFHIGDNWERLIDELYTKPHPLCGYCSDKSESFEWKNGSPQKEDWLINETN